LSLSMFFASYHCHSLSTLLFKKIHPSD
jgi:hypothetical protein